MGSIGQVSCGKTVGKWPRKANTQTRHGQRAFPCYFSDFYRENDARISIRSLYLSLSLDFVRSCDLKERGGKEGKKKNLNETGNTFSNILHRIFELYLILDSSAIDAPKSPYRKTYYYSNCPDSDGQSHPLVARRFTHCNRARKKFNIISETRNSLLILCFILHFIHRLQFIVKKKKRKFLYNHPIRYNIPRDKL